jgi:hypothetical protein
MVTVLLHASVVARGCAHSAAFQQLQRQLFSSVAEDLQQTPRSDLLSHHP